jgi:outer membrane lipoprotein
MKASFSKKTFLLGLLVPLAFLWGCSVVPREVRKEADLSISFRELQRNPDAYSGRAVLLGGEILQASNLKEETELQVLQKPLGRRDVPVETEGSEGRFIVTHDGYLDPAVYRAGYYVTTVGEVTGSRMLKVGGAEHLVPVIRSEFLRLFTTPRYANYSYGPYDYPYYSYYPYYPYWWGWGWGGWWGWPGPFFGHGFHDHDHDDHGHDDHGGGGHGGGGEHGPGGWHGGGGGHGGGGHR